MSEKLSMFVLGVLLVPFTIFIFMAIFNIPLGGING